MSVMMDEVHVRRRPFLFVHQFVSVRNESGRQSFIAESGNGYCAATEH